MTAKLLLGQTTLYPLYYAPELLTPIPRAAGRLACGLEPVWPYAGGDLWTCYELSWLSTTGMAQVAVLQMDVAAHSPALVESKSLKLYLNSLNLTRFVDAQQVLQTIAGDLQPLLGVCPTLRLWEPDAWQALQVQSPGGYCLDNEPGVTVPERPAADCLQRESATSERSWVEERYYSHLFRSLCPVTGQPDWATVQIAYTGPRLTPASLLAYLLAFRQQADFHEQCVERIFNDLLIAGQPKELQVMASFTRRGGIDISPYRSLTPTTERPQRTIRQ